MTSTIRKPPTGSATCDPGGESVSRDLSWLDFNARVLDEARMPVNPLLERLRFIAIFSSNLDEFFMVRVAGLIRKMESGTSVEDNPGHSPRELWTMIRRKIAAMLRIRHRLLTGEILPRLAERGVFLRRFADLPERKRRAMREFFRMEIMPALTPLAAAPGQRFPLINQEVIELAARIVFPKSGKSTVAVVEVPEVLERFIPLPGTGKRREFLLLEDLIAENVHMLFPGGKTGGTQLFRIIRDMDYSIDMDDRDENDPLNAMRSKLRRCRGRNPVRLEFSTEVGDGELRQYLADALKVPREYCCGIPGALHLRQFADLIPAVAESDMLETPWQPVVPEIFRRHPTVFSAVSAAGSIMLVHPYQSFSPIVRLLEEAADDPQVLAIKQTLYRVSGNSPVVNALLRAAANGKQVTVLVEIKARFDESNNITWAEMLDHSGAHVVYGVPALKVHCKTLLIVRREAGKLRKYVHFGTGNYNDRTATQYTDVSLLSCRPGLAGDAERLFNVLCGGAEPPEYWHAIAVAPFDLRAKFSSLVEREIALGNGGRIIAKMNSLSDPGMIALLRRAAAAGVEIDLIVRGICCIFPLPGQKNFHIVSIVDRYLEHGRIFFFGNGGKGEMYCSSADWMTRNLDRRVETMFPVTDEAQRDTLMNILLLQIQDRDKGRRLGSSGRYTRPGGRRYGGSRSQRRIYELFSPGE